MLVRKIWKCIHPRVSYSYKFSYCLYAHAINVLLYRMKPRKHIYVKCCWQAYSKSIGTLSQIFKNHIVTVACKWCVPSASDVFLSKNDNSGGKTREAFGIWFLSCMITCPDLYPLSNQINLFMVINIWGIIIILIYCLPLYHSNMIFIYFFILFNHGVGV